MSQLKRQSGFRRPSSPTWPEACCCAVATAAARSSCGDPLDLLQVEIIIANPMTCHWCGHSSFFIPALFFYSTPGLSPQNWAPLCIFSIFNIAHQNTFPPIQNLNDLYFFKKAVVLVVVYSWHANLISNSKSSVQLLNLTRALLQPVSVHALGLLIFSFSFSSLKIFWHPKSQVNQYKMWRAPTQRQLDRWQGIKISIFKYLLFTIALFRGNTRVEGHDLDQAWKGPFLWRSRCLMCMCNNFSCV